MAFRLTDQPFVMKKVLSLTDLICGNILSCTFLNTVDVKKFVSQESKFDLNSFDIGNNKIDFENLKFLN